MNQIVILSWINCKMGDCILSKILFDLYLFGCKINKFDNEYMNFWNKYIYLL